MLHTLWQRRGGGGRAVMLNWVCFSRIATEQRFTNFNNINTTSLFCWPIPFYLYIDLCNIPPRTRATPCIRDICKAILFTKRHLSYFIVEGFLDGIYCCICFGPFYAYRPNIFKYYEKRNTNTTIIRIIGIPNRYLYKLYGICLGTSIQVVVRDTYTYLHNIWAWQILYTKSYWSFICIFFHILCV